jgi:hypothetical protein
MMDGWDSWDSWDRGPQPMIHFTTRYMVVGEKITMNDLLSVYQGNANAMSDEDTFQRKQRTRVEGTPCEDARITLYWQQCRITNRRRLDTISRQKGATA